MAQDFLPFDIHPGQDLDATKIQKNFEAVEAKFPLRGKDITEVFGSTINWSGVTIPTEVINTDELFNVATNLTAALGCLDLRQGMRLVYDTATTFRVTYGQVLHRGKLKIHSTTGTACHAGGIAPGEAYTPADILIPGECDTTEGNPSGLDYGDGRTWWYVYAKLDVSGAAPEFRVSGKRPVWCAGKGPEHPDNDLLRYIGVLKPLSDGSIRPFVAQEDGWTWWRTAAANSTDQLKRYMHEDDESDYTNASNFTRLSKDNSYWDGPRHIPPTADWVWIYVRDNAANENGTLRTRPIGDAGAGVHWRNEAGMTKLPVNMPGIDSIDMQTFEYADSNGGELLQIAGFHDPW